MLRRWRWASLLWSYAAAVFRHWAALVGGVVVLLLQQLIDTTDLDWKAPGWLKPSGWLLLSIAQYLAWRDAWEARGTVDEPTVARGIGIAFQALVEKPVDGHTWISIHSALMATECLRGRLFTVYCNGPIVTSRSTATWVTGDEHEPLWLNNVIKPDTTSSLLLDFTPPVVSHMLGDPLADREALPMKTIALQIATHGATGVVRIDEFPLEPRQNWTLRVRQMLRRHTA